MLCNPPPFGQIACPSGNITLTDNGNPFLGGNSFALNNQGFTQTFPEYVALTGGTHTLAAQYSGDNNYNANTGSVVITVTKAKTSTNSPYESGSDFTQPVTL